MSYLPVKESLSRKCVWKDEREKYKGGTISTFSIIEEEDQKTYKTTKSKIQLANGNRQLETRKSLPALELAV